LLLNGATCGCYVPGASGEVSLSFPAGGAPAGGGGVVAVHEAFLAQSGCDQHAVFVLPVPVGLYKLTSVRPIAF
jgi:hypothetical protein